MYLLDTNVISEIRKAAGGKADQNVVKWVASVSAGHTFLSVVTVMELEMGVLQIERRDRTQGTLLRTWLNDHILPTFSERILTIDTDIARRCARLHVPDRQSDRDALIAATALCHDMTVVTRNVDDFDARSVSLINPWDA